MTVEERYYKYTRTYMLRKEFEMMKREMTKNDYMQITHFTKLCLRLPLRSVYHREILFGYRRYNKVISGYGKSSILNFNTKFSKGSVRSTKRIIWYTG
jgi:hypothetical protein